MTRPPELLTSPSNPLIKSLKSLERKKERAESGLFLAEGDLVVERALRNPFVLADIERGREPVYGA